MGNLKDILTEYKRNMLRVSPFVVQRATSQISSALVYLHANRIIYRDLKADNVLVWLFPKPNQLAGSLVQREFLTNSGENVYLKLADYSISRCVLPTGAKGFAGTLGFMAPEILKFNGEETYSEKVDCFSFAMLLYELISLKHPFEGQEQIKDIILNGGRPVLKNADLFFPTLMLDLMCLCWLENPRERPTARDIQKYTNSYEFSHLLDVAVLEDFVQQPLFVTCKNQEQEVSDQDIIQSVSMSAAKLYDDDSYENEEIEEEDCLDVWIVRNADDDQHPSQFEILTYENNLNCASRKTITIGKDQIEVLCVYNKNQIWCLDATKTVYIYCSRTYRLIYQYALDINIKSKFVCMFGMEDMSQILLCTENGMILLLKLDRLHVLSARNNDDFDLVDKELEYLLIDVSLKVNTCIVLHSRHEKNYDLWIGSTHGEIFCFSLKFMKLIGSYLHSTSHYCLNAAHTSTPKKLNNQFSFENNNSKSSSLAKEVKLESNLIDGDVTIIKSTQSDAFFLWSYVCPGSTIFLWNHVSKKIMSSYNCQRAFEEFKHVSNSTNFKIVDLTFLNGQLMCALSSGIVIVFKRLTLTPLFMYSAHMHQLHNLCPLSFETRLITLHRLGTQFSATQSNTTSMVKNTQNVLLSLGRALSPAHEDIYLSSSKYRIDALSNYANCLILCAWNTNKE